jgi:uncharacterized protein YjiK
VTTELIRLGLIAILVLVSCSKKSPESHIRFPYQWVDAPGYGGNIDRDGFKEPSGITYHPLRKTLFVVSDEGEVEEIGTDGVRVSYIKVPGDLEDITVHPDTGMLYIVVEGDDVILEFDPELHQVTRRFLVSREFAGNPDFLQKTVEGYDNGLESLAFVPDAAHPEGGTFYAGNQWDPPAILEIEVPLMSGKGAFSEARILRVFPFKIDDPAAISFDASRQVLCAVSDADNIYIEIKLDGTLVAEYAFLGDNQEGIAWDEEGFLYIAQDSGGILKVRDLRKR